MKKSLFFSRTSSSKVENSSFFGFFVIFFPILQYFHFSWFLRFSSKFFLIFQINFRKIKLFQKFKLKVMKIIADFFKFSLFIWKIFGIFLILWFLFRKIKKNSTKFFKYSFYILYFYLENSKKKNSNFHFSKFSKFQEFSTSMSSFSKKKNVFLFFYFPVRSIPILSFSLLFGSSGPLSVCSCANTMALKRRGGTARELGANYAASGSCSKEPEF